MMLGNRHNVDENFLLDDLFIFLNSNKKLFLIIKISKKIFFFLKFFYSLVNYPINTQFNPMTICLINLQNIFFL
jgi:hypothetical protein